MSGISGKTFILTGASGGIGRALALALAGEGAGLVLNARNRRALEEVEEECTKAGARVDSLAGSAAAAEVAGGLVEKAIKAGNFYGFIQVAGVLHPGPVVCDLSRGRVRRNIRSERNGKLPDGEGRLPAFGRSGRRNCRLFRLGSVGKGYSGNGGILCR